MNELEIITTKKDYSVQLPKQQKKKKNFPRTFYAKLSTLTCVNQASTIHAQQIIKIVKPCLMRVAMTRNYYEGVKHFS